MLRKAIFEWKSLQKKHLSPLIASLLICSCSEFDSMAKNMRFLELSVLLSKCGHVSISIELILVVLFGTILVKIIYRYHSKFFFYFTLFFPFDLELTLSVVIAGIWCWFWVCIELNRYKVNILKNIYTYRCAGCFPII